MEEEDNKLKRKRNEEDNDSDDNIWKTSPQNIKKGSGKIHRIECASVKHSKLSWEDYEPVENIEHFQKCAFCKR